MVHVSTSPTDDGLICSFYTGKSDAPLFDYHFRRIVIGLTFPDPSAHQRGTGYGIGVVVGERVFFSDNPARPPERIYVVLDEADAVLSADLFRVLILLKDRYRVAIIYCPPSPASLVEELKRQQGLTHYLERNPAVCRSLWPTFVSLKLTAGIQEVGVDDGTMHRDIEILLNTTAKHPDTNEPIRMGGSVFQPIPRLVLPDDLPTQKTRTGIRQATPEICRALWYALTGLEISRGWRPRREGPMEARDRGITGY